MTTIISLPDDKTSDAFAASSGQSAQQNSKWLYELERAQWQVKQHPAPFARNLPKSIGSETSLNFRPQQQVVKFTGNIDIEPIPAGRQVDFLSANAAIQQPINVAGTKVSLPSSDCAAAIPITALVPIPLPTKHAPANSIVLLENAHGVTSTDRKWDKLRAHVEENDGEINLWLRDTRLDNTQGIQLAMALRKRFAEIGYRLACFTLNGRTLPLDPAVKIPTHS